MYPSGKFSGLLRTAFLYPLYLCFIIFYVKISLYHLFPLQILQDEVGEFVVEVQTGVAAVNGVVFVGIEEHLVLLVGLVELCHEVDGILEMHVVVGRAVDEQVVALQLVGEEAR